MNFILRTSILVGLAAMCCLAGCSRGGPETVPVYGTVNFIGRDVPKYCRLFFQPLQTEGISRPSSATAEADGSYEVKAFRRSAGLVPGTYRVQISYYNLKRGANPEVESNWVESVYDAGELVVDAGSRGVEHNIEVPAES